LGAEVDDPVASCEMATCGCGLEVPASVSYG
jgi:hypothetical protein